jgi:hypothetical protein
MFIELCLRSRSVVGRPCCIAMKSFLVLEAMKKSNDGDFIVWIDSSKYFHGIQGNISRFIHMMTSSHGLTAFPGTALCGLLNIDNGVVSEATFRAVWLNNPFYWFATHFQDIFFVFQKNKRNLQFMTEWTKYEMDTTLNCLSASDDQAIFLLLVT